tara:strand:+ start:752 stop:1552 length:801 start_codon:yes stop_codon:yes gene_type:complete
MSRFRIAFFGEGRISAEALQLISDVPFMSEFEVGLLVTSETVRRSAIERGVVSDSVPFISNSRRYVEETLSVIEKTDIDIVLSVQHIWILAPEILDAVGGNAFNLHNAQLPEYKGYNSVSHAIINGDETFHSTLHWMDPVVDSGDIAFEGVIPILPDDTAVSLYERSVASAVEQVRLLLQGVKEGHVPRRPLEGDGRFYRRGELETLKNLTQVSDEMEIDRLVRGAFFPPHEPAYVEKSGRKHYLLPRRGWDGIIPRLKSANEPTW